ncbi:hypothetical protein HAX54_022902 [Datura stramonium]|uniref:Secreted protein n=1 Tax=Datura stramonium TaxID=4076 RepID=A0ABS8UX99_DATST|nr:hypothetical protein [Datura stramonium]
MGGIAIFALALVPPFSYPTPVMPHQSPLTRWDEVPQESERPPYPSASAIGLEMAARDCSSNWPNCLLNLFCSIDVGGISAAISYAAKDELHRPIRRYFGLIGCTSLARGSTEHQTDLIQFSHPVYMRFGGSSSSFLSCWSSYFVPSFAGCSFALLRSSFILWVGAPAPQSTIRSKLSVTSYGHIGEGKGRSRSHLYGPRPCHEPDSNRRFPDARSGFEPF